MKERHKKIFSVFVIIILLPYVLMVFIKGEGAFPMSSSGGNDMVQVLVNDEIIDISWEEYLIGLLAKEIPYEYELEAMKAQAIIIRTRLAIESEAWTDGESCYYTEDYYTTAEIQVKWSGNTSVEIYAELTEAIEETEGMALYYEGNLAITPYHALNNGETRDGNEVLLSDEYPYLVSVSCPLDLLAEDEISMMSISYDSMVEKLGLDESINIEEIRIVSLDAAGYVLTVNVDGQVISGETFRTALALKSSAFTIEVNDGSILITTLGNGHGLGLSQNTAHYMALEGKNYIEILAYFYVGTQVLEIE